MMGSWGTASFAVGPKVYFTENFRNYHDKAPTVIEAEGITVGNDPVWTQTADINLDLKKDALILKEYSPSPTIAPDLKNYDVVFKFRLCKSRVAETLGKFELRLRQQIGGKPGEIRVAISTDEVKIMGDGSAASVKGEAKLPFTIERDQWRTCVVTVRDGKMAVFIDEVRVMQKVADVTIPSGVGAGINFYGFTNFAFSISEIEVREPAALPDRSIANILPIVPKVDAAAFKAGGAVTVPANDLFGATVRTGLEPDGVQMSVKWNDGRSDVISFSAVDFRDERLTKEDGKTVKKPYDWPNAIIRVTGIGDPKKPINYHIRPKLGRYQTSYSYTDTYHDITRDWEKLPAASDHPLKIEARRSPKGVDLYLDGCYAGTLEGSGVKEINFAAASSASIGPVFSLKTKYEASKFLPLDLAAQKMAKSFAGASSSVPAGLSELKGIPMFVATSEESADVGLTREGQGNWALEVDEYLARSPFDGLLTEVHFTVPGGSPYAKAWVLAAVDPDPAKDPIFTTRIAKYVEHGAGGNQLADTVITLPRNGETPGEGITPVGTVTKTDKSGKKVEVPLYLVEVPLNGGKIIDLMMDETSLNFEFFGKPWENFEQIDNSIKPDPKSTSAVQIFGVTLEHAPVGLAFIQSQPANIFHNGEKPETTAVLKSGAAAKGKLAWEILDVDGKKTGGGSKDFAFAKAGEEQKVLLPLDVPQVGWYELRVLIQDASGKTVLTHPASFGVLGKDERKAKYDSPYGTWWFDGAHKTPKELSFAGPVMFKAGMRKASWTKATEKDMAQWYITRGQLNTPLDFPDLKTPEKSLEKAEIAFKKLVEAYPSTREVAIFHESGPGNDLPVELFGQKPQLTEWRTGHEKRYADLVNLSGAFFREKFPQMKLVVGNNSASQSVMAAVLRHGGKIEYIDYIGIEAPSQVYIPEKLQEWSVQGMHIAMDTVKAISGRHVPATGCYEFTYRSERDMGQQQQAEWYVRDMLISLANNFTLISPGILFDTSNAYYNGLWGGSGVLERAPYGYPKKSYVAYAALTNVFDQVKLRRQIPTGSTTVYAVEFDRADGKKATALWASRGDAEFNIEFAGDTPVRVVDMYGRSREEKTAGGKLVVKAGTSPVYLLAGKEIGKVTLGKRSFPKDEARAALANVAAPLDNLNDVKLDYDNGIDTLWTVPLQTPVRQIGEFDLRAVNDEEKGGSLELELKKKGDVNKYITEYVTVRLNKPAEVSGTPAAMGVWVKGNSNWGRVMFEIEDADGEVWRSLGTTGWGCDVLDWPGNIAVNFDGWNFVALPLRDTKLFNDHSPGPVSEQWVSSGGDKKIAYPIKVRALIVEMHRTPLDLADFKPATPVIRLKDVSGVYEK